MGESGWGKRAAPGAGAARRLGRGQRAAPEMPRSPAALRAAAESERARRRERAAKTSCSELKSPLPLPTPQTQPVPPQARLRNLAPAPTTIVPAHLTPSREGGGGGGAAAWERWGDWAREAAGASWGRWVPQHFWGRGSGEEGRRGCGRGGTGREEAGRGEMWRQRRSATQELLRGETKGCRGGRGGGPRQGGGAT